MIRLTILFLAVLSAFPADWTVNQPEVLSKEVTKLNDRLSVRIRVRFKDDSTPQTTVEKDYVLSGPGLAAQLARAVYDDQQELQTAEALLAGNIAPQAPTPPVTLTAAQADYVAAVLDLMSLVHLKSLGLTSIGGSLIDTVIAGRISAIQTGVNTANKLDAVLKYTPRD